MTRCSAAVCGLDWFSSAEEKLVRELEYACVYAVGPIKGRPLFVGASNDPRRKLMEIANLHWQGLKVHEMAWTAGPPLAKRLERELQKLLKGRHMHAQWYDVTVDLIVPAFQIATDKSGVKTWTHQGMLDHVADLRERRIEKAVRDANLM